MSKLSDQLIYANDLSRLYDALNELLDARDEGELSNPEMVARIVYKFENFADTHKVRTNDLITLGEKIEKARSEYRILHQKYKQAVDQVKTTKQLINRIMNDAVEKCTGRWLLLTWSPATSNLLYKVYGTRLHQNVPQFAGVCVECFRPFKHGNSKEVEAESELTQPFLIRLYPG